MALSWLEKNEQRIAQGLLPGLVLFSIFKDDLDKGLNSKVKSEDDTNFIWVVKYCSSGKEL